MAGSVCGGLLARPVLPAPEAAALGVDGQVSGRMLCCPLECAERLLRSVSVARLQILGKELNLVFGVCGFLDFFLLSRCCCVSRRHCLVLVVGLAGSEGVHADPWLSAGDTGDVDVTTAVIG